MSGQSRLYQTIVFAASAAVSITFLSGLTATPAAAQTVTIKCESKGNRFAHCAKQNIANVRLTRQLSNKPCFKGSGWGVDANGIWVNQGCRALFTADVVSAGSGGSTGSGSGHGGGNTGGRTFTHRGTGGSSGGTGTAGGTGSTGTGTFGSGGGGSNIVVTCRSTPGRWKFCQVNVPGSATLKRQISNRACTKGLTWGFVADGVWTADGCSARFDVN